MGTRPRAALAALAAAALLAPQALAQTLTFGPGGAGGSGPWNVTTPNWFDGVSDVAWIQGRSALFSSAPGAVTVGVPISAQDLTFAIDGYSITGGTLTLGVGLTPTITLAPGITSTLTCSVAGTNGLVVTGGGTLALLGTVTFTGGTFVNGATLEVDGNQTGNRLAPNSLVTVNSGGTFRILGVNALPNNANSLDVTVNAGGALNVVSGTSPASTAQSHAHLENVALNDGSIVLGYSGSGSAYAGESFLLRGDLIATGSSSISYGPLGNSSNSGIALFGVRTFMVANAGDVLTVTAQLENPDVGAGTLVKAGAGTLNLFGGNSFTGGTVVNGGTLVVDGNQQVDRLATNSLVTINGGGTFRILGVNALPSNANAVDMTINAGGLLDVVGGSSPQSNAPSHAHIRDLALNSGSVVIDFSGSGSVYQSESFVLNGELTATGTSSISYGALATTANSGVGMNGARTFTVVNSGDVLNIAAQLEDGDSTIGGVVKAGSGTLSLAGTHSYTGTTTVNAGTLVLNGSIVSPLLTVNNGGTLAGSGATSATLLANIGSTVSPGQGPGTLATGTATLAGTLAVDILGVAAGAQHDRLLVSGSATLSSGPLTLSGAYVPAAGDIFAIVQASGGIVGTFGGLADNAIVTFNGVPLRINYNATSVTLLALATVTPSAGANGTISPNTPQFVSVGATTTFTVTPNAGYTASVGGTCGGALVGNTYTTNAITANCTVAASFSQITFTVTPSAGANGTIAPSTPQTVAQGATTSFTVTPSAGYTAAVGGSCGGTLVGNTYTTSAIAADCTVSASFTAAAVTTFSGPSATGSGMITASFTGGGLTCTYTVSQFIPLTGHAASPPAGTAPAGVTFPHGLFDFTTSGCTPGSTITMTITYPAALAPGTQYWKYGPTPGNAVPHWYVLPAAIVGATATFSITDGGTGDDDLAANGTIVDQGGPGGGGGGGSVTGIPTLSEWMLLLLALLVLTLGTRRHNKGADPFIRFSYGCNPAFPREVTCLTGSGPGAEHSGLVAPQGAHL